MEYQWTNNSWLIYMFTSRQSPALQDLPSTYCILILVPFLLLTAKPKERNLLQSTLEKFPFWNQSLTVKALFKPLWLHYYNNSCRNTEWQITLDIQMAPFKCFVMSLIKLRWTLSFTDWHRYANDLYCIRCPLCLQILHSAAFRGQTQVFECKSQLSGWMEVKGWENASAFFHLAPAWACTSKVLGNINSRWGWGPICTVGLFLWYK